MFRCLVGVQAKVKARLEDGLLWDIQDLTHLQMTESSSQQKGVSEPVPWLLGRIIRSCFCGLVGNPRSTTVFAPLPTSTKVLSRASFIPAGVGGYPSTVVSCSSIALLDDLGGGVMFELARKADA